MLNQSENLDATFPKTVQKCIERYFSMHKNCDIPPGLYNRILTEVERILFSVTLDYAKGNQQKAAQILGINRNTLRKKMAILGENDRR
ncbi:MAG: Fis family transcriptional regulator [Holosporaceae bacterium]|jgi:two-component system nitrogen regulation response regulator GlnG|nr:Fis family transcriptional regulator [Holosporaceae bacterium]